MTVTWPEFEKRLRARTRAEIANSPALKAEYKRTRRKKSLRTAPFVRTLLVSYLVLALFGGMIARTGDTTLALAVLSLWATGTAFRYGQSWFQHFYASQELVVFSFLPLADRQIFRIQWRRFLLNSSWLIVGYLALYALLWRLAEKPPLPLSVAVPIALAQPAVILAFGLNLAAWLSFVPLGAVAGLFRAAAVILLFAGPLLQEYAGYVSNLAFAISPSGWLNLLLLDSAKTFDLTTLLLLMPLAIVLYGSVYAWHRLRGHYSLEAFEFHQLDTPAQQTAELEEGDFIRRGPTEIEDNIMEGGFLKPIPWSDLPWFEKTFARLLNPRERNIVEFLVAGNPAWTVGLKWSFLVFALALSAVSIFGKFGGFAIFLPGYLLLATVLPLSGNFWRGFAQMPCGGGAFVPAYSIVPITFDEIAHVVFKFNLVRTLIVSPLLVAFTVFCGWRMGFSLPQSFVFAAKVLGLLLAMQPLLLILPFSKTTNDISGRKFFAAFVLLPLLVAFAGFSVIFFSSQETAWIAGSFLTIVIASLMLFLSYRWAYRSNRFDLLTLRVSGSGD